MPQFNQIQPLTVKSYGVRLPKVVIEKEDKENYGIKDTDTSDEILRKLAYIGLKSRVQEGLIKKSDLKVYTDKIEYELGVLSETKFSTYIVLVWDTINCAKKKGIPVGCGRGSSTSSLVNYLLHITDIDPIQNGLFFERFISKSRAKVTTVDGVDYFDGGLLPDVDTDICHNRRHEVIDFLQKKYNGKFCKLSILSTLQSKALIKDVAKCVESFSEDQAKAVSDTIPVLYGRVFGLEEAEKNSEKFKEFTDTHKDIYKIAKKLYGLPKSVGSHASAFLVCFDDLDSFMPCQTGTDNEMITSLDMTYAQTSAIKLDLLGLQAVTLIDAIANNVGIDHNEIDIHSYEDIYKHLKDLQYPYGLFQISGDCNYRVVRDIRPKNLDGLSAVVAIARPGALSYLDDYAEYSKTGDQKPVHEFFGDVLAHTGGLPIYQEETLAMFVKMGFSPDEGETIRRIIGKKARDKMPEWKEKIHTKVESQGLDKEIGDVFWKLAEESAEYSFAAAHAYAYATIAAKLVYLKFKYPQQFYLECLKIAQHKADSALEIGEIAKEMKMMGLSLLPPDILKSKMDFYIEGNSIRFALGSVKGVAEAAIAKLKKFIDAETSNKFEVFEAAKSSKLNIGIFSSLIQAGAIASISEDRPKTVLEAQVWNLLTDRERRYCLANGGRYNFDLLEMLKKYDTWLLESGVKMIKDTRIETIRRKSDTYIKIFKQNSQFKLLSAYFYETKLLGYSHSHTLKEIFEYSNEYLSNTKELKNSKSEGENAETVCRVVSVRKGLSKKGDEYIKMVLGDEYGNFDFMMFGRVYDKFKKEGGVVPEEGNILYCCGRMGRDILWIERMAVQDYNIYSRLADLKEST